jgi:micrococcal nuclease
MRACDRETTAPGDTTATTGTASTATTGPGGTAATDGTAATGATATGGTADTAATDTGGTTIGPSGTVVPWGIAATLLQVVDGDTIWVRTADGIEEKVRYIGINAPEIAHEDSPADYLGPEAAQHNAELLAAGPLRLETDVEQRDEYGRLLAYVWAGEVFVNERMVLDGYAWAHNYPPNTTRQEVLWAAHDGARAAGIGVWAESQQ